MKLNDLTLSPTEIAAIQQALPTLSIKEKMELFDMLEEREKRYGVAAARQDMISFAKRVYPGFKVGPHHRKLAKIFTDVIEGRKNRVIINIAPRMGKSEFSSYLFPAFFLGNYPNKKIIMGTHTASLSEDFGRKVRNLIASEDYRELFPRTVVADDQKAAGKRGTGAGGNECRSPRGAWGRAKGYCDAASRIPGARHFICRAVCRSGCIDGGAC